MVPIISLLTAERLLIAYGEKRDGDFPLATILNRLWRKSLVNNDISTTLYRLQRKNELNSNGYTVLNTLVLEVYDLFVVNT